MSSPLYDPAHQALESQKYCAKLYSVIPREGGGWWLTHGPRRELVSEFRSAEALLTYLAEDFEKNLESAQLEALRAREYQARLSDLLDLDGVTIDL